MKELSGMLGGANKTLNVGEKAEEAGKLSTRQDAKTRRVFGIPGSSLVSASSLDADARTAGIDGEKRVAEELERLATLYPNTYVFHSVKLPRHEGDIDHVVVQGDLILLVDSKNWKNDAVYSVDKWDHDFILRDGETFSGSYINLTNQVKDWQKQFALYGGRVRAALTIANRKSQIQPNRAPYAFVNMDGLEKTFSEVFSKRLIPPMRWKTLKFFLSMLQTPDGMSFASRPDRLPKFFSLERTARLTKLLVLWSVINLFVGLFPVCFLTTVPLLIVGHIHQAKLKRLKMKGTGWMKFVLASSYIITGLWSLIIAFLLIQGVF